MNKKLFIVLLFSVSINYAQSIEKAHNNPDKSLSLIHAFIVNTLKGNTITEFNDVNIDTKKVGKYTILLKIFKSNTSQKTFFLNEIDTLTFDKSVHNLKDTPANKLIKKLIKKKRKFIKNTNFYTADFYAKNTYFIKNAPKKLMGIDFRDFNGSIDSTKSGRVYLSETISQIRVKRNQLKEIVKAVKVNGLYNKSGFNRASNVHINLYKNVVTLGDKIVSPIANFSFLFYKFHIVDTLKINNHKIFKIKVLPRNKITNTFTGFIYVVDGFWQLYKVDLQVSGKQILHPNIDKIKLYQQFEFSTSNNSWLLQQQKIDFKFSALDIYLNGSFLSIYNNYQFKKTKPKQALLTYNPNFDKSDAFWNKNRPIPLTKAEKEEYQKKKNIYKKRTTKKYLDSINKINNKFYLSKVLFDYNYLDLNKKYRFSVRFPINVQFNTVQGWNTTSSIWFYKDKNHQNYQIGTKFNYGFSDKKLRITGHFLYRFNDKVNSVLKVNFGKQLTEFNDPYSTAPLFNTLSTLLFEENNAKYYDKFFTEIKYHQELFNGFFLHTKIAFENRKPAFNHSNFVLINWKNTQYTSNNPKAPNDFIHPIISKHNMLKFSISATYKIGQKYLLFPDRKINLPTAYPQIGITFTKGKSFTNTKYNYDYIESRLFQKFKISNKGTFAYNVKAGKFIHKNTLSFVDYKHFDITQVHISLVKDYTNHFALLPNYDFSTDDKYAEFHTEHQFNGYILNKIPLIKKLQFKLIVGANTLLTTENFPYSEFNIGLNNVGFGKYRFLRIDYVRTFINNQSTGSFIFGLSL